MRPDPDYIETARAGDREVALLAAEVRRLKAVIAASEPMLTDEEREAIEASREFWEVEAACSFGDETDSEPDRRYEAALRGLLERTK
jgi:hypothetical protein